MALQLQFVALVGFAGLMLVAAFEDLRRLMIPNSLILALCVVWPFYFATAPNLYGGLGALGSAAGVFLAGAFCFSRGWLGGGDVKLLSAATLWAGPAATPTLLVLTGLFGGILALFVMMPPGAYIATLARAKLGPSAAASNPPGRGLEAPVPYGIAIAGAATIVTFLPHIG
jgi:prepilin peptidase CpaA